MPHIEELPVTSKHAAPGYSYVVDTGLDPSKAAINPTNRKRVRISTAAGISSSSSDLTARQQTAIQRHLDELDRDNHRPVAINPPKSRLESGRKLTTNVRRILNSGKDFSHYLEEEEAALALRGPGGAFPADTTTTTTTTTTVDTDHAKPAKPAQRASKTPIARRKSAIAVSAHTSSHESSPAPSSAPASARPLPSQAQQPATTAFPPRAQPPQSQPAPLFANITSTDTLSLLAPPASATTTTISEAEIEALLSAPPLPYSAARAAPPPATDPPQRAFCEICGYWGRVRCLKCGARVCGLECKGAHEESRCVRF